MSSNEQRLAHIMADTIFNTKRVYLAQTLYLAATAGTSTVCPWAQVSFQGRLLGLVILDCPRDEICCRCMVEIIGPGCAHKHPDFIIVNSGAHDSLNSLNKFAAKMQRLASWLGEVQLKYGSLVIWRGNNGLGSLHAFETIARYHIESEGLNFLDVSTYLAAFAEDLHTGCCSDKDGNGLHVGVIGKYHHNANRNGTYIHVSSMITQGLLERMFVKVKARCRRIQSHN